MKIYIIGGGAAGFFAALAAKEHNPLAQVVLVERTNQLLAKVRISGGGRCNVTHACFEPQLLVQHYPRGSKELLGPFHTFGPRETLEWFSQRGVALKTEKDGRIFPVSDSSETIIACLLNEAEKLGVEIRKQVKVESVEPFDADRVIVATGSGRTGWEIAKECGHTIQSPVPSLFTFNCPDSPLLALSGVSVPRAKLWLKGSPFEETGPLLITHWGFSGPVALKLSAFAARYLAEKDYHVHLCIDWLPDCTEEELRQELAQPPSLPKRLWKAMCSRLGISKLHNINKHDRERLIALLKRDSFEMRGKTTYKEEFVTCGGVTLKEIDFKTMQSKLTPKLFFCGEVLDIDGVTGGFNFQNAWTTGWIAGRSASIGF